MRGEKTMDIAELKVLVRTEGADKAQKQMKGLEHSAGKAEKAVSSLARVAKILSFAGMGMLGKELLQMADQMEKLKAQIRLVSKAGEDYNAIMRQIGMVGNSTYQSLDATAKLYTRTRRAMEAYGKTSQDVMKFTESVANAMRVSGASTQEQESAILQLSQALGSGKLQGDELRSIAESAPLLLDQIAQSLGVSRAEIKKMGSEGKITADKVFNAMIEGADKLKAQAKTIPPGIGEAMTVVKNNVMMLSESLNTSFGGVTQAIAQGIIFLGMHIKELVFVAGAAFIGWLGSVVSISGVVGAALGGLKTAFTVLKTAMMTNPVGILLVGLATLIAYLGQADEALYTLKAVANSVSDAIGFAWNDLVSVFSDSETATAASLVGISKTTKKEKDGWSTIFGGFFDDTGDGFFGILAKAGRVFDAIAILVRSSATYMGEVFGAFQKMVEVIWENIKNTVINKVQGFINKLIKGVDFINKKLGISTFGSIDLGGGEIKEAKLELRKFSDVYDEVAKTQSQSGLESVVKRLRKEFEATRKETEKLKKTKDEALSGGGVTPPNITNPGKGGKGKKGSGKSAVDEWKQIYGGLTQQMLDAKQKLNDMMDFGQYTPQYTALRDLMSDIQNNSDKYKPFSQSQIEELKSVARKIDDIKQKTAIKGFSLNNNKKLDDMAFENSLIGLQADEVERLRFARELENQVKQLSVGMSAENLAALEAEKQKILATRDAIVAKREEMERVKGNDWFGGIKAGIEGLGKSTGTTFDLMKNATTGAFTKMADGIANFVATGKGNFKELTASILSDMSKMLVKAAMMRMFGGLFKGLGLFADGGVFGSNGIIEQAKGGAWLRGVQYYANGGVFGSPTMFAHAGGLGVMGEAGPEAIMPLSRGSDGKLGVKVHNANQRQRVAGINNNINIAVNINNGKEESDVKSQQQQGKQLGENLKNAVRGVLAEEMRSGGMLASAG
ncbi:MAG: phage tail tape measure protein [Gammaproteobacteria bacterium]|nr:phage tail tape measure protein [Gammaproteobacteria bacterium]